MDPYIMEDIKREFIIWITKWWTIIVYIGMSTVTKLSYDILNRKKLSWAYVFATVAICWTLGGISAVICMKSWPDYVPFVVPMCTIFSDRILIWVGSRDWTPALDSWYKIFTRKNQDP